MDIWMSKVEINKSWRALRRAKCVPFFGQVLLWVRYKVGLHFSTADEWNQGG